MSLSLLGLFARQNAKARDAEFERLADRETREGIDVDLWRALPDSPNAVTPVELEIDPYSAKALDDFTMSDPDGDDIMIPKGAVVEKTSWFYQQRPEMFGPNEVPKTD